VHALLQPVADHARGGRLGQRGHEDLVGVGHGDGQRRGQAALPGVAKGAVGDDAGGQRHVGVGQDDDRVLGAALRLHALAVGRSPA
jgi:hypothetical protein